MDLVGFYYNNITLFILVICWPSFRSSLLPHLQCLLWQLEPCRRGQGISPKHRWPYTRLHKNTSALKVHFNVRQNGTESKRCSLTHGYNILVHKFVYKANITTSPNYFKLAMILCHVVCPSVCRFVFVSTETKLKSQLHTITQPDGSNELHRNASFGWRFGVISCLLCHDAFTFVGGGLVQVSII